MSYIRHLMVMCGLLLSVLSFNVHAYEEFCPNIAAHRNAVQIGCQGIQGASSNGTWKMTAPCGYTADRNPQPLCERLNPRPVSKSVPTNWNIGSYCPAGGNGPPTCACKAKHNWNPKAQACQPKGSF